MNLSALDRQLLAARDASEAPALSDHVWHSLATTIRDEIAGLGETVTNRLRLHLPIPPERYQEELTAFQSWMDIARANATNPVIVRAQVMTSLYVAFVWLRDSLMQPVATALSDQSAFVQVEVFLRDGPPRRLRNAIAHGHWCYLPDFSGLEYWDGPRHPRQRFQISDIDLEAWQLLSRGAAIAALLALTDSTGDDV